MTQEELKQECTRIAQEVFKPQGRNIFISVEDLELAAETGFKKALELVRDKVLNGHHMGLVSAQGLLDQFRELVK